MIHWTKIKKAVEEYGGTWTDRLAGEAFLAKLGVSLEEEEAKPAPVVSTTASAEASFDPAKPYSTIMGEIEGAPGARYSQGGHYFNAQGKKVG